MKKIAPSDRLRKELKEFIEGLQDVECHGVLDLK